METKKEIRQKIRTKRRELEERVWKQSSEDIYETVVSHPWFLEAKVIYTYVDHNREAETRKIIKTAFETGKNVWVPKVTGKVMHFYHIGSLEELKPGAYGIMEPAVDVLTDRQIVEEDSKNTSNMALKDDVKDDINEKYGLMIMPGVAFDEECRRIGYGGGYYDKYLAEHPKLHRMALAFDFQIFPEVPHEKYDICPEIVITEKRIVESK